MLRQLIFVLLAGWLLAACGGNDAPGGIGPGPDAAVSGTVLDQRGLPVEGVVVSDGLLTTLTDEFGNYTLDSDLSKRRFVQVTIPAAYEIPVKDGIPQFWQRIPEGSAKVRADFTLTARRKAASRYTILMTADPQIRSRNARYDNFAFHSIDVYEEMCRDLQETAASITDRPVYSISLGDLVHNDMSLYPTYCAGIADFDFPVFNVIGNHDHVQNVATDREAVKKFEEYLGPTCYSVELGELHFIFLDNIIMKNNTLDPNTTGAYNDGLSDEVYSWLCNDLKYVDKNKIVMLCAHSSMFRKPDSEPAERDKHGPDYASRLAQYRFVHSWAGHSHINFNYAYAAEEPAAKFPNVESHILARSTGALWLNERISTDGTPRGYLVVDVDGEQISWYYKPLGLGRDRQIRAYAPGVWYDDGYVYANVWNHDARWGEVRYTDSGKDKAEMKRVTAYDGAFVRMADYYNSAQSTATFEPFRTSHMFRILPTAGATQATIETTDRFELLDSGHFWLAEDPSRPNKGWDAKYVRICCWGRFLDRETQERFWFFSLHTDHKGERAQVESCRLVLDKIRMMCRGERAVLTGDFNVGETSESYAVLRDSGLLSDTYDLAEIKYAWTGTENGFDPDRKTFRHIDYLFVTPGFRVLRYGILTDTYRTEEPEGSAKPFRARTPSDHFPVLVEMDFAE